MNSSALLDHIISQTRQNVEILMSQNQLSLSEGREILAKLPSAPLSRNPPYPPPTQVQAKALWGYNEQNQDLSDLSFRAGDVIEIIAETNADWWTGRHNDKQGLFPSNYVEKLPPSGGDRNPSSNSMPNMPSVFPPSRPYLPAYQGPGGYQAAPPQQYQSLPPPQGYQQPPFQTYGQYVPPPQVPLPASAPEPPQKQNFGGKLGNTLAHSAAGGLGFGAGSAVGSGIINSIF